MDQTATIFETIGAQGRTLKSEWPGIIGQDATTVFLAEQAELRRAGVPASAARVGARMPDAALARMDGSATTLAGEVGDGPAVLVFYRGAWCPFCNLTLRTYETDLVPALRAREIPILAISPQATGRAAQLAEDRGLSFPLLSDPGNGLARRLGITTQPTAPAVEQLQRIDADAADFNADGTREVPYPTVVVVDAGRRIRFIDVHPDYSTRTEVADVLVAVDEVLLSA